MCIKTNRTKKKMRQITLCMICCIIMVFSLLQMTQISYAAIGDGGLPEGYIKIEEISNTIVPGITDKKITMNTEKGDKQNIVFSCEVDMSKNTTEMLAGYKDYQGKEWGMQTLPDQIKKAEKATGKNVVAAINADYFDMSNGAPIGALVMDGTVYNNANGQPYFAILKDGKAVIRDGSQPLDDVKEAVGGRPIVLKDGELINVEGDDYNTIPYSRTAIGIKADGNVVMLTTHGRINPISYGMSMKDMGEILMGQGCVDGLILDGGGSSTYCAKYEGETNIKTVNNPSDGTERLISSSILVTSSAKATGEFDHASVSPNNKVYTPGSKVKFTAKGVDSAGGNASLPKDLVWKVAKDSEDKGTVSDDGIFASNGTTGDVTVELCQPDGTAVGKSSILIEEPDTLSFTNSEISLGFNKKSDLGVMAKYKGREVVFKDGDFKWELIPDDESAAPEDMGSFDGNTFTSSEGKSVNGYIKCTYKGKDKEITAQLYAIIGRLPTVAMDFEDQTDSEGNTIDAYTYWIDSEKGKLKTVNYGRGGKESIELVDVKDDEEHVRFGSKALKINYDFSNISGTEGASVGYKVDEDNSIEGTPTAVGMWVYAPEGTANFWLRIRVADADGQTQNLDFTPEISNDKTELGGISWTGWKYVEAPLVKSKSGEALKAPFKLLAGECIRFMCVPGTGMGYYLPDGTTVGDAERKGCIYIDNVRFVYGANVDDLDAPELEYVTVNDTKLADGKTTIETNDVTVKASVYDVEGSTATGVDWDRTHVYIDGKELTYQKAGDMLQTSNVGLANGEHKLKLVICDGFGNKTTEVRSFKVNGEKDFTTVESERLTEGDILLNSTQKFVLKTNNIKNLQNVDTDIQLNKLFAEDTIKVTFPEGIDGTYKYDSESGVLHVTAEVKSAGETAEAAEIAAFEFKIPADTANGVRFRYGISDGKYTIKDSEGHQTTFGTIDTNEEVKAAYAVSSDALISGSSNQYVYVKDSNDKAVSGASIYYKDGTLLGKTGDKGYIKANKLTAKADEYELYAVKDENYSFITRINVLPAAGNEEGVPSQITSLAVKDPSSSKAFSWFSNPDAAEQSAVLQVAEAEAYNKDGESAFKSYEGTSKLHAYSGAKDKANNVTSLINKATATGLKCDTEYVYRVGDGNYWSDVDKFTLKRKGTDTNLFIFGDTQSEDTTNVDRIMNELEESGIDYNLGIQTGDLVDSAAVYSNWVSALDIFNKNSLIKNTDILHAIGNHEREGDQTLTAASEIFNMPDKNHYSVEYGNVYIATLSYAFSESQLKEDLEWLKEDAQKSKAAWKIVVTHQPAYYTNTAGSNDLMHELLPPAAEAAGIDFVFSGHDHSYARTEPLANGKVDEDNGIVYYICGSTGEKSYGITDNKDFHFAELNSAYNAVYLTVKADDKEFKVTTHDMGGSVMDSYTKTSKAECTKGHSYIIDGSKYLECEKCGHAVKVKGYTGFVKDSETNASKYLINGEIKTGWGMIKDKAYYFNADGEQQKVTVKKSKKTECTSNGYTIYYCETASDADGKEYRVGAGLNAPGHEYDDNYVCKTCGWKAIKLSECDITLKTTRPSYTGEEVKPKVTVKKDGKVFNSHYDYRVSYSNNTDFGKATVTIDPNVKYYIDMTQVRSSFLPEDAVEKSFTIVPEAVKNLKVKSSGNTTIKLSWNKSLGADGYKVYKWNASKNAYTAYTSISGNDKTSCTVKNLKAGKTYIFKVNAYGKNSAGKTYLSNRAKVKAVTKPYKVEYLKLSSSNKSITAKWDKRDCSGYQIRYSTSSTFKTYKNIYAKKSSTVSKKITKLKAGKKYYVKVRAYKKADGVSTAYGSWSTVKSITVR